MRYARLIRKNNLWKITFEKKKRNYYRFAVNGKMTLVQPTVEMQQHIRSELNEDVSTREKDLEHIKEWLRMQPHLPQFQGESSIFSMCIIILLSIL